jgi:hypothetical protein
VHPSVVTYAKGMVKSDGSNADQDPPSANDDEVEGNEGKGPEEGDEASTAKNLGRSKEVELLPDEVPGDLSKWIISTMPTTAAARTRIVAKMEEHKAIMEEANGGNRLYNKALTLDPLGFLPYQWSVPGWNAWLK